MSDKYKSDNILDKQRFVLRKQRYYKCITEADFYPPYDDRVLESYVEDIDGGDNFADYAKYIFNLYEEEGYYEN